MSRDEIARLLEADVRVAYALAFGSAARAASHAGSDLDIGVGLAPGARLDPIEIGDLIARLEAAAGRDVDLVDLGQAPPGLAYRAFRDGQLLFERDHARLVEHKTRAIVEYLDFEPVERALTEGALRAAGRGR
jgi:predicted nucleotidyltransferase